MNGFVFRMPLVWLVAMGLVACGAAGEVPGTPGTNGTATAHTDRADGDGPLPLGSRLPDDDQSDPAAAGDDDGANDGNSDDEHDSPTPGVEVNVGDHGITVTVDLPDGGIIKIDTKNGTSATAGTGVYIDGDVTIDLGAGLPIPLADADLQLEMGSGMPTLSGTANVSGSLLDGIGCGCADDSLPVMVSLDADASAELPDAAGGLAIALNLPMKDLAIDTSSLPMGLSAMVLGDADVTIKSDGQHHWLSVAGQVTSDGDVWASTVPLQASGGLATIATLADGVLLAVQLQGNVTLEGGELWCGITPLSAITMPDARLKLDEGGLWLHATAQASAHPGFSVTGTALVDGRFTAQTWSLMVCADVMTDVLSASVKLGQCVEMTPGGSETCDCHRDDHGHCDGGV